jgi:parallel beta-helix repeat protein
MMHRAVLLTFPIVAACFPDGGDPGVVTNAPTNAPAPTALAAPAPPDVINVKDYGALGDGVANDAPAIRDALNAVGPNGGTVMFPPGTYLVNSNESLNCPPMSVGLCPKPKTRLVGAGGTSILKRGANAGALVYQNGGSEYVVESLAFDANGAGSGASTSFFNAVGFVGASRVRIENTHVFDSSGLPSAPGRHGILVYTSDHVVVAHNHLDGGLRIKVGSPGNRVVVEGNVVDDANDNAISLAIGGASTEAADYIIRGNIVRGARGASIYIGSDDGAPAQTVRNIIVDSNVLSGPLLPGVGLIVIRTAHPETGRIVITSNVLDNSMATKVSFTIGIVVTTQTPPYTQRAHDLVIANNAIRGPFDYAGIWLRSVDRATISGNAVDCGSTTACNGAIWVQATADVSIAGNTVGNAANAFYIDDSSRITVSGNTARDVGQGMFLVARTGITTSANVTSNVISNATTGIFEHPFTGGSYDTTYALNDLRGATTPTAPAHLGRVKVANSGIDATTASWDPPGVTATACATTTLAIPQALPGDAVTVTFTQPLPPGAILGGNVSGYGSVTIALCAVGTSFDLLPGTLTATTSRR